VCNVKKHTRGGIFSLGGRRITLMTQLFSGAGEHSPHLHPPPTHSICTDAGQREKKMNKVFFFFSFLSFFSFPGAI
jgi:hypothetical protein